MQLTNEIVRDIADLMNQAGQAIMQIYKNTVEVNYKQDDSPLTNADAKAHRIITNHLASYNIPILSEENVEDSTYDGDQPIDCYWLVDPLDGTKEFIKQNGQFTINIALIDHGRPVFGMIYLPALEEYYYAISGHGSYKMIKDQTYVIKCSHIQSLNLATIAVSVSHLNTKDQNFINKNQIPHVKPLGSSLKYCRIAEGEVDLSVRYSPLMQWDIAASQIIVEEAGGRLTDFQRRQYHYQYANDMDILKLQDGLIVDNGFLNVSL
jgi:3'(2'), 5'-bisphosphate nucleotidase